MTAQRAESFQGVAEAPTGGAQVEHIGRSPRNVWDSSTALRLRHVCAPTSVPPARPLCPSPPTVQTASLSLLHPASASVPSD